MEFAAGMPDSHPMANSTSLTRAEVAAMIDHTLLAPEATTADVDALIAEARALGVYAICVSPSMLPVRAPGVAIATVAGFLPANTIRW